MNALHLCSAGLVSSAIAVAAGCRPPGMPTSGGLVITEIEYSPHCGVCTEAWNEQHRQVIPSDVLLDVVPWLDETGVAALPGGIESDPYVADSTPPRLTVRFAGQPPRTFDVSECFEPTVCAFLERLEAAGLIRRPRKDGCDDAPRSRPRTPWSVSRADGRCVVRPDGWPVRSGSLRPPSGG